MIRQYYSIRSIDLSIKLYVTEQIACHRAGCMSQIRLYVTDHIVCHRSDSIEKTQHIIRNVDYCKSSDQLTGYNIIIRTCFEQCAMSDDLLLTACLATWQ